MSAFLALGFFDVWPLAASLRGKALGRFREDETHPGWHRLCVRDGAGKHIAGYGEWVALKNVVGRIERLSREHDYGEVWLDWLKPKATTPWRRLDEDPWMPAVLPIVTNPAAWFFGGAELRHIEIGWLTAIDRSWPLAVVNWGDHHALWLSIAFRKKEKEDGVGA
jgi:hypothetical protein